jgi:hypothetical protein
MVNHHLCNLNRLERHFPRTDPESRSQPISEPHSHNAPHSRPDLILEFASYQRAARIRCGTLFAEFKAWLQSLHPQRRP